MTLWEIDIHPAEDAADTRGNTLRGDADSLGLPTGWQVHTARGFLLEGSITATAARAAARTLLVDPVVERSVVAPVGDPDLSSGGPQFPLLVCVLLKPGVTDPVADSTAEALQQMGIAATRVATVKKYWFSAPAAPLLTTITAKLLANDSIEQAITGPLQIDHFECGAPYCFQRESVRLRDLNDQALLQLSREGQLSLSLQEMRTIQQYFQALDREPTDVELESIAQTWSEHCSHKTLAGPITYADEHGERHFRNMLKETIFAATETIRTNLGSRDWCVSVFQDNAGIVQFDDRHHVAFKVETHNHPSALEPYGGANTGIGGVIRDILGTGLGAKPIANTDVFCFAPTDTPTDQLPPGVLHPQRVLRGVVAGVRRLWQSHGNPHRQWRDCV